LAWFCQYPLHLGILKEPTSTSKIRETHFISLFLFANAKRMYESVQNIKMIAPHSMSCITGNVDNKWVNWCFICRAKHKTVYEGLFWFFKKRNRHKYTIF
jgi:hypothetical protein